MELYAERYAAVVAAARVSLTCHLAMADAIIYTTALIHRADFITSDAHFQACHR